MPILRIHGINKVLKYMKIKGNNKIHSINVFISRLLIRRQSSNRYLSFEKNNRNSIQFNLIQNYNNNNKTIMIIIK